MKNVKWRRGVERNSVKEKGVKELQKKNDVDYVEEKLR